MIGAVRAILYNDALRLLRDQFLVGASAYIVALAVALRWVAPWAEAELSASAGFSLAPYVPLAVSYFALVNSTVLTGMLGGFLLLETREERAIHALRVTPTPLWLHLAALGAVVLAAGFALMLTEAAIIGVGVPAAGPAAAAAALVAPMGIVFALILASAASNKVEAFAVMKMTGFLGLVPIGAYFLPEPWQHLAGVVPVYWGCKLWWMAAAGEAGWAWLVGPGLLCSAAWIGLLLRRFQAVSSR